MIVFHVTEPSRWRDAEATGVYTGSTRGASLDEVGFVHCSFAQQVERVTDFLYADYAGPLVLLEVDTDRNGAEVRVENLDGGTELFPHLYGPVLVESVVTVRRMERSGRGWGVGGELAP